MKTAQILKWERLWFLLLTFTFGLTLTWLYFWWEVHNDYDEFNWYLYNRMGYWSDWSVPILITTAAAFTYVAGLLVCGTLSGGRWPCSQGERDLAWAGLMEGPALD
ncbi:Glycerophosphodiester phosphodiesterase domain-containing protein 5 [Camelus dromedarius]|uniref:Glycerophosphodiester phosphodiesterase domain-containing protein 5 n=1 Tax=Camelus dromedarius TaxID=9838 RepID=A0A5N4DMP6_CAMDR|nr:Glycerophosphodiester phosphodiesterase domain-containing protein 5 [Camelus dromedarius]